MSPHILLVDDDPLLRRSVAFSLERAAYRVTTAASAEDALALADRDHPDADQTVAQPDTDRWHQPE